jgi:DNA polymerase III epsilon subunit family exonuclease
MQEKISIYDLPSFDSYIVLDTETTYNYAENREELIEFCGFEINNSFDILTKFEFLVNPNCRISKQTMEITGICDNHILDKPSIDNYLDKLHSFLHNKNVFAHNANFDKKVLENAFNKYSFNIPNCNFIDTLKIARNIFPSQSNSLTNLKKRFNIEYESHRAKGDVLATIELISRFNDIYKEKGINLFTTLDSFKI